MTRQKLGRRHKSRELDNNQFFELWIGPGERSAFRSEADRRRAWQEHREEFLAHMNPGILPWAAEQYDRGPAPEHPGEAPAASLQDRPTARAGGNKSKDTLIPGRTETVF